MSTSTAAMIALVYWISQAKAWYGSSIIRVSLSTAPIMGLIFNDMPTALSVGITLQMIYVESITPGESPPADKGLASCIAIPVTLIADIKSETAISLTIPLGLPGVVLESVRRTLDTTFIRMVGHYAEKGDIESVQRAVTIYPLLLAFPMRFVPVFIACLYDPDATASFVNLLPTRSMNDPITAGNILPALDFAMIIIIVGRKQYIPLLIIGFFLVTYPGLDTIGAPVFRLCAVLLYIQLQNTKGTKNG